MRSPVRKAVFPVAGLGTRFLPATKAMPKEMLPIVDKPLIHYAVEEAKAAGIEQFFFVTSRGKSAIDDHFDRAFELEATLRERGKEDVLEELEARLPEPGQIAYTRQQTPLGLGHAVWCARELVGDEPFAVLLADDLMVCEVPCLAQMVEAYGDTGGNLPTPSDDLDRITRSEVTLDGDNAGNDGVHAPEHVQRVLDGDETLRRDLGGIAGQVERVFRARQHERNDVRQRSRHRDRQRGLARRAANLDPAGMRCAAMVDRQRSPIRVRRHALDTIDCAVAQERQHGVECVRRPVRELELE